jgi:hypothetical protein
MADKEIILQLYRLFVGGTCENFQQFGRNCSPRFPRKRSGAGSTNRCQIEGTIFSILPDQTCRDDTERTQYANC